MPTRQQFVSLVFALALVAGARNAAAQCTPGGPQIPNFRTVSFTNHQWTLAWDPPSGAVAGTQYEVVGTGGTGYCHFNPTETVVATTTNTQYTANLSVPDITYGFYVRLQSDHCVATNFRYVSDTFTTLANKPPQPTIVVNGSDVTLSFSYDDDRSFDIAILRAAPGGNFTQQGSALTCDNDPKSFTDKSVPPGTYVYELAAVDDAGETDSDPVTVTVGAAAPLTFTAVPQTIHLGQSATLSWVAPGASGVTIDNGVGAAGASGSVSVSPSATTTYTLTSSNGATAKVTVTVITNPAIAAGAAPAPIVQSQNSGGGTTSYTLTNAGGTVTTINLSQNGNFFSQSPTSFTLGPGESQVVTVTGFAEPAGAYEGTSSPQGAGVAAGMAMKIKLLSVPPPNGTAAGKPATNRIDVAAAAGSNPSGSVTFTNNGTGTLTGIAVSDVPWIVPQGGLITIPAGGSVAVTFTIDRSQRPDATSLLGSASGNISLVYPSGAPGTLGVTPVTGVSIVTVVDTVQLSVTQGAAPPPLSPGEVALFVPGAGHAASSVGTFISDISILNPQGNNSINDLKFYFQPLNPAVLPSSAALPAVGNTGIALADVVNSVFGAAGNLGTLQIRSASVTKVSVNTDIFNTSNAAGTYGTTIPTFRSDRAVVAGDHLVLTGLRQDATGHTNLFIQETSGTGVTVQTQVLDVNGVTLGTPRSDTVGPFGLAFVTGAVPQGAVAAILTNMSTGGATFLAYATPVDQASGDNWAIVDWSRQYGYSGSDAVIIPVAGVLHGANSTFFRTDVAITNSGTGSGAGTLRFYPRGGSPTDQQITLGSHQTRVLTNVIGSLFNEPDGSVGYLQFTPSSGTFVMTSRTYTTAAGSVATFGTSVPTVPASSASPLGSLRAIGSLQDSSVGSITAQRPATFRTNFGLLETSGNGVTVRVTLRYSYPAGVKVTAFGSAQKDYTLGPNEFRQVNGIANDILGSARDALGDLHDLEADFQIVSGSGTVIVYTSSTDNGTGDVILRME